MSFKSFARNAVKSAIEHTEVRIRELNSDIDRASKYGSNMSDDRLKDRYTNAKSVGEKYGYAQELKKRGY